MTKTEKAKRYLEIQTLLATLEKEKDALKDDLKDQGSFENAEIAVEVSRIRREQLASIAEFDKAIGRQTLEKKGLLRRIQYTQVRVRNRGAS